MDAHGIYLGYISFPGMKDLERKKKTHNLSEAQCNLEVFFAVCYYEQILSLFFFGEVIGMLSRVLGQYCFSFVRFSATVHHVY